MAEIMERNLNLEEVDSDALFGLKALKDQSAFQKIIFWGSVSIGVLANVVLPMVFGVSRILCVFIFLVLLIFGVGFGCNYTKDLTYGKYVYQIIFKPTKELKFQSAMGKEQLMKTNEQLIKAEDKKLNQVANKENQRRLLKKIVIFIICIVVVISAAFAYKSISSNNVHHTVKIDKEV